jgi:nickel-dependent lactate racemase
MAGYSGGRKSVCPGLVDLTTVQQFHGPELLSHPKTKVGVIEGNPCHRESLDVALAVPPDMIFNVTINATAEITGIFAGDLEQAHLTGAKFVEEHMLIEVPECFDAVFTSGGGYPLDTTFYQAVKGMSAGSDLLGDRGTVIIATCCEEGIGSQEFQDILFEYTDDYDRFLKDIFTADEVRRDQWEIQMRAGILKKTSREGLIVVCDGIETETLRRCTVTPGAEVVGDGTATDQIEKLVAHVAENTSNVAVIPRGPFIISRVAGR